ncbi:MAG: YgeY family selenium metabolism-linked hydrolase [Chloroflexi bacterium]|nr:YgeY family selenium metabolism-linked hydrolase [Chloroflexota bacterium]
MLSKVNQEEVVEFAREIIRRNSPSGQEGEVARLVESKMRSLGYDRVQVDPYGNVIGLRFGKNPGGTVLFDGHMDVVPVTNSEAWTEEPFSAAVREGKIWGRGASDMKGPLAAAIVALGRIPVDEFSGTLAVSASIGEEVHEGAALAKVNEQVHPDGVVICEPNGCKLGVGQKGRAGIKIEVFGKPAHSSVPHLGENAIYRAVEIINRLRRMALPTDPLLGEGVMELIDGISSPYPSLSTVPVQFTMRYDRRLVQDETMESVRASIQASLEGLADWSMVIPKVKIETYPGEVLKEPDFHPGWAIDPGSPWIRKASRGLEMAGIQPETTTARFCTNGSYTAGVAGLPTLIFGPSSGLLAHCVDEYIAIDELIQGAEGYWGLAKELAK